MYDETIEDLSSVIDLDGKEYIPYDYFNFEDIRWQHQLMYDIKETDQFAQGTHTITLSGAYGSAKSAMAAYIMWDYLLENPGAEGCLARHVMKDLKESNLRTFLKMAPAGWVEGVDFVWNKAMSTIELCNGSRVVCISYHNDNYDQFKSRQFRVYHIEEATESGNIKWWHACLSRSNRHKSIKQCLIIATTNPEDPEHEMYEEIIAKSGWIDGVRSIDPESNPKIHTYYSVTQDNPFLGETYYEDQCAIYSPKQIERYLHGKWISLEGNGIYYEFHEGNIVNEDYNINLAYPIVISHDFNIALNKPMSVTFSQFINDHLHVFDELIVAGADTLQICQAIADRGIFDHHTSFIITGDASGWARDSTSSWSDYDIIKQFCANYKTKRVDHNGQLIPLQYKLKIPRHSKNPGVKARHQLVNSYCKLANGLVRLHIYKKCKTTITGMKLTKLKDRDTYIEDDSKSYQHSTTTIGYKLWWLTRKEASLEQYLPQ